MTLNPGDMGVCAVGVYRPRSSAIARPTLLSYVSMILSSTIASNLWMAVVGNYSQL